MCIWKPGRWLEVSMLPVKSCGRPTRPKFSIVFLGPTANHELVPKIHVALHVSHAAVTKSFAKTQPSQRDQNSCNVALPKLHFSPPLLNTCPLLLIPNSPLPVTLHFSLPLVFFFLLCYRPTSGGTLWRTTTRKVAGSISDGVIGIFH